jgi:hypothetical protein
MVWDLRRALLKKEEFESGRLTDFEFREMVRALRLLAERLDQPVRPMLDELAERGETAALEWLATHSGQAGSEVDLRYRQARAEVRRQLIAERGDPSPIRLG